MKEILDELNELNVQRERCELAVKANGQYEPSLIAGLTVYKDNFCTNFDKTKLATKLYVLKHKTACAKLKLVNERIKFLTKQLTKE